MLDKFDFYNVYIYNKLIFKKHWRDSLKLRLKHQNDRKLPTNI